MTVVLPGSENFVWKITMAYLLHFSKRREEWGWWNDEGNGKHVHKSISVPIHTIT